MSEQELDNLIRDALLDAEDLDEQARDSVAEFIPSNRYLRQMRSMCRNPVHWARRKTRPRWKTALQRAAVFFLAVSVSSGCALAAVPQARAGVMQWVLEWYDHDIVYRFGGEPASDVLPEYSITNLPDGFSEVDKGVFPTAVNIIYENDASDVIGFDYGYMNQGSLLSVGTDDMVVSDITVNHCAGRYFETQISGNFNFITWIDEEAGLYFMIVTAFDKDTILDIAESVSLVKMTN